MSSLKRTLAAVLAGLMMAGPAVALPQGGEVVSGKATISIVNSTTVRIQQYSANVIINWKGFSVGANELVQFLQPGAMSVAVNRVIGGGASIILGLITANGRTSLITPPGSASAPVPWSTWVAWSPPRST
jgi:filamentous haemagglutinin family N-terminal domain